jgi:GxxExxY protein
MQDRAPDESAKSFPAIPFDTEQVASQVIGAAIEVHRHLGPGFLEKIYQEALCIELHLRGIRYERERPIVVRYRDVPIPGQRVDLIISGCVVVELLAAAQFDKAHEARLISYLRSTGLRLGLLLNFNFVTLKQGVKRIVV